MKKENIHNLKNNMTIMIVLNPRALNLNLKQIKELLGYKI